MSELSRNSTIKELIESKQSLKALRTILKTRDTTVKEVFNYANYFQDESKKWINTSSNELDNVTFNDVLAQIKSKNQSTNKPKVNKQLIESNTIQKANSNTNSDSVANNELTETNSIEALNAIGLTPVEFSVLKSIIAERLEQDSSIGREGIYNQVAALKTRKRKNQTFYISEDLAKDVLSLADDLGIKKSQLVEVALLEFMKRFSSIQ